MYLYMPLPNTRHHARHETAAERTREQKTTQLYSLLLLCWPCSGGNNRSLGDRRGCRGLGWLVGGRGRKVGDVEAQGEASQVDLEDGPAGVPVPPAGAVRAPRARGR